MTKDLSYQIYIKKPPLNVPKSPELWGAEHIKAGKIVHLKKI